MRRGAAAHRATAAAMAASMPHGMRRPRRTRPGEPLFVATADLLPDQREYLPPAGRELRIRGERLPLAAFARDRDLHDALDAPRTPREDEAPVPQEGGLLHVVGHQEDGLAGGDGDPVQLLLEGDARLRVHG